MKKITAPYLALLAAAVALAVAVIPVFAIKDMRLLGLAESIAIGTASGGTGVVLDSTGSTSTTNGGAPGVVRLFAGSFSKYKTFYLIALAKFINAIAYLLEFFVGEQMASPFLSDLVSDIGAIVWIVVFISALLATRRILQRKM